jgi:hypothetical protein
MLVVKPSNRTPPKFDSDRVPQRFVPMNYEIPSRRGAAHYVSPHTNFKPKWLGKQLQFIAKTEKYD